MAVIDRARIAGLGKLLGLTAFLFVVFTAAGFALSTPERTGTVVDQAGILDPATIDALTQRLADLQAATGDEVVVATLSDLQGRSIEDWGTLLVHDWNVGRANGKDNGVLLIVAPNDRKTRIAVGYGVSNLIPDDRAAAIISDHMLPYFRGERFAEGITAGVRSIAAALDTKSVTNPNAQPVQRTLQSQIRPYWLQLKSISPWILIGIVVLVVLAFNAGNVGPRRRWSDRYGGSYWGNDYYGSGSHSFFGGGSSGGGGFFSGGGSGGGGGGGHSGGASGSW